MFHNISSRQNKVNFNFIFFLFNRLNLNGATNTLDSEWVDRNRGWWVESGLGWVERGLWWAVG